jgi:hypothetical protein
MAFAGCQDRSGRSTALAPSAARRVREHPKTSSRKGSRFRANADHDSPSFVQYLDLPPPLGPEFGHAEHPIPNRFEIGRRMTFAAEARSISADQAELIIRHGISPLETPFGR